MPLVYQQNINLNSRLGLWHIGEGEDFFTERKIFANGIRHPHKRLQTLSGRLLLIELFPDFPLEEVRVAPTRKPFLESEAFHFSISHCDDYAAAIVSREQRVGVDIEVPREKVRVLKDKFLSAAEQELLGNRTGLSLTDLTMAWCMKEAAYKWYGEGKVDFREHMPLKTFSGTPEGYDAEMVFRKGKETPLILTGMLLNGNCLAWVTSA